MEWLSLMNKPVFNCDREWWNSLAEDEKENWLNWAKSCGADREPFLVGRNPNYPDLICSPSVSYGTFKTVDLPEEILEDIRQSLRIE